MRRTASHVLAVVTLVVALSACGGSGDDGGDAASTTTAAAAGAQASTTAQTTTTAAASAEPVAVLVTNDDGYQAEGIDALVEALREVDGVEVTVVAPLDQRSGTGGKTTPGKLAVTDVKLASGYRAKAVDGFPADTIRVALDELGVEPDVVISGINAGQNLGPAVDLSGTVGAARAAVDKGIPALAASQGAGNPFDYPAAVPYVLDWLEDFRAKAAKGAEADLDHVDNLNVPTCATGEVRGLLDVPAQLGGDVAKALAAAECTSSAPKSDLADDVAAFGAGYATLDEIPAMAA